jgi:hypothetical protein
MSRKINICVLKQLSKVLPAALCLLCTLPAYADFTNGDFTFTENGARCTLIKYSGKGGRVDIPRTATKIENGATLAYTVTDIAEKAFYDCAVLSAVTIPAGVERIGKYAFRGCSRLAFVAIPESVTVIDERAFNYCPALDSLTIPASVTTIGRYAFEGCTGLAYIKIPDSVTDLGEYAFAGCEKLTTINVDSWNSEWASEDGVLYNKDKSLLHTFPAGRKGKFVVPSSVTTIGNGAFSYCAKLSAILISPSVTTIGGYAFKSCTGLDSIAMPNSILYIGNGAFSNCTGLESVSIPNSVINIEDGAFDGCTSLKNITLAWTMQQLAPVVIGDLFDGVDLGIISLNVPADMKKCYQAEKAWKKFDKIVEAK